MNDDFGFLFGSWTVQHRRLNRRLAGDDTWTEFGGHCDARPLLGGAGNVDDNVLDLPGVAGGSYRAASLRSFDAASGVWSIWWLDGRDPGRIDAPLVGRFEGGVGTFHADDVFEGRPIRVRFRWTDTATPAPRWEQAFSDDGGARWEVNWTMVFTRRHSGA